jgi:hypothetical protein
MLVPGTFGVLPVLDPPAMRFFYPIGHRTSSRAAAAEPTRKACRAKSAGVRFPNELCGRSELWCSRHPRPPAPPALVLAHPLTAAGLRRGAGNCRSGPAGWRMARRERYLEVTGPAENAGARAPEASLDLPPSSTLTLKGSGQGRRGPPVPPSLWLATRPLRASDSARKSGSVGNPVVRRAIGVASLMNPATRSTALTRAHALQNAVTLSRRECRSSAASRRWSFTREPQPDGVRLSPRVGSQRRRGLSW